MQLPPMWQVTPLAVVAVGAGTAHEVGLRWLALRQTPEHRRRFRRRSYLFYAGLALMALVVSGPLERWSMSRLSVHMVLHVAEMFYLPPLMVLAGPTVPLLFAIPVDTRRRLLRRWYGSRGTQPLRAVARLATHPVAAVVLFNVVMVTWHIPAVFDWASYREWAMQWLMAPSFVVVGLLFWRVILPSHPHPPKGSTVVQVVGVVATAFEMLVLAMSMAIFTHHPWYRMNVVMLGPARALRDQHIAAGILWICGDFWAIPALALVAHRVLSTDGSVSLRLEKALGRA